MTDFGKMIDKLIEISTNQDISDEVKCNLDDVIDELIHLEIENNGEKLIVPDFSDLSPEEMEEIKQFAIAEFEYKGAIKSISCVPEKLELNV